MMTDIRFYHMTRQSLDEVLPHIVEKAYAGAQKKGQTIRIQMENAGETEIMSKRLWSFKQQSFLPHGTAKDGQAERQPIWLNDNEDNLNKAETLFLTQGQTCEDLSSYDLVCEMLNGHDDGMMTAARARWKTYKEQGHNLTYWYQDADKGWIKKDI